MNQLNSTNYNFIAEVINYIQTNFKDNLNLDAVATKFHLTPFDFKQLFIDWAGTDPNIFLHYTSIQYAKKLLTENQNNLFEKPLQTQLFDKNRFHNLNVKIKSMSPTELKNGGESLTINYSFANSIFGNILIASTSKGICHISFIEEENQAFLKLNSQYPNANFIQYLDLIQQNALVIFSQDWYQLKQIKLHFKGTDFQLKVWETLLKIPLGQLTTYGNIAKQINNLNASRAVGTAIGDNPVAFLIPCHRVIQGTGKLGGYMWGITRKLAIIGWEATKINIVSPL